MIEIQEIHGILAQVKSLGYSLAIDNTALDMTLKDIEKYRDIDVFKIGNALSNALIKRPETKKIMIEFIKMFNEIGKKAIVEGIERDELIHDMQEHCLHNQDMVMYSRRLI